MDKKFDIQSYMTRGVERIVADALRTTVKNPRESAYMLKFAAARLGICAVLMVAVAAACALLCRYDYSSFSGFFDRHGPCI